MTGPGLLDDLTTQLGDFMALPADLDLPKLCHVKLERRSDQPGWSALAQLDRYYGPDVWECVRAWASATGGTVHVSKPHHAHSSKPWRSVAVTVSHAGLEVEVWGHVDADDPIPAWAQPPAPQALTHAAFFTPRGGRDTTRAACGNAEASATTHPDAVTCATCRLILVMGEAAR